MVLQNLESVLRERNLKSCTSQFGPEGASYLDQQVEVQVGAPRIFLAFILESSAFLQIDTLHQESAML